MRPDPPESDFLLLVEERAASQGNIRILAASRLVQPV
jgi:hypothetical protein